MILSRLRRADSMAMLRIASVLALVSLALMCWGILDPRPLPVIVGMSIGQVIGTVGALLFVFVVLRDLRERLGAPRAPPTAPSSPPEDRPGVSP